jgi:hypothetical protein
MLRFLKTIAMGSLLISGLVNLIKNRAVGEVRLLRFLPTAENFIDGDKFDLRKS